MGRKKNPMDDIPGKIPSKKMSGETQGTNPELGDTSGVWDSSQGCMGMGNAPRVLDSKGVCEMGGEALEVDALGKGITNNAGATTQAMGDSSKLLRSAITLTSGGAILAVNTLGDATISAKTSGWTQGRDASDGKGDSYGDPRQGDTGLGSASALVNASEALGDASQARSESGKWEVVRRRRRRGDFDGNLRLGGSLCGSLGIGRVDPCMGETDLGTKTPLREVDVPSCGGDRGAQANRGNTVDVR
ncbi:unnamed protein product [Ilex paraguariensis]|uniref:Uncharacterized protein n=1 Tax=Ilex paraguariensis TaxID=185542 RepID=A0ABC8V437_9AQUA